MSKTLHPQTLTICGGKEQTQYREYNQVLFLTSSFMSESVQQDMTLFAKETKGFTYTRAANPTIAIFEQRISALEGVERLVATPTGMSAIQTSSFTLPKAGDHVVSGRSLFGTTAGFIDNIVTKFGIEVSYVFQTSLSEWRAAVKENIKLLFPGTPSSPLNEVADLEALSETAHAAGVLLMVDESFLSPVGQQPLKYEADISVQSVTKAIDGHGRVMDSVLSGPEGLITQVVMYYNSCGLAMSPFSAWVLSSGMETLSARMEKQFVGVLKITRWLSEQPQVKAVYYSGLPGHPQAALAAEQQLGNDTAVGFEVSGKDVAWSLLDKVELFSRTANLGDVCSTIIHSWITTHGHMSPENKQATGTRPGLLRLVTSLEYPDDLIADLQQTMA